MQTMNEQAAQGAAQVAESRLTGAEIDRETVIALALKASETKKGGAVFKASALKDKVRAQVRSRLGLERSQLVPAEVNALICDVCDAIVPAFNADLAKRGFVAERASGERLRVRGKEGEERIDRTITVLHAQDRTLAEQVADARMELARIADLLDKWERGLAPNGKPDNRDNETRDLAKARLLDRAALFERAKANAERELSRIAELARVNGIN